MIPLKLQIKNFLSYGSETQLVDFEPYNLICLSGKNGHGKSALLDSMTWAIWGEARKSLATSKPDQGLIRLGQRQMYVIFDFEFNKNKYRIRREFTNAYGKGYAYLEFGIFENDEKLISLTDKTIKATQEKIESMLGLNYDSFSNSAFLRQGNSNEFSKKSAKDRKEILASILGLNKYENLRKIALEKIKNFTFEKETVLKINEHIKNELSNYDETLLNIQKIESEFKDLIDKENLLNKNKQILEIEKSNLAVKLQEYKLLNFQISKLKEDKNYKFNQLRNFKEQWKDGHRKKNIYFKAERHRNKKIYFNKRN